MKVYRLENAKGEGPWSAQPTGFTRPGGREIFKGSHLPPAWWDVGFRDDDEGEDVRVGVKSLDDAKRWFSVEDRRWAKRNGFKLAVYDVPEDAVWIGRHQVSFDRVKAVRVEERDPVGARPRRQGDELRRQLAVWRGRGGRARRGFGARRRRRSVRAFWRALWHGLRTTRRRAAG